MRVPVLHGSTVRLRPLDEGDLPRIAEIRQTPEVALRWRGRDLAKELAEDFADEELIQFAIEAKDARVVGFTPMGVMRSYERQSDGSWADALLMELIATDWYLLG